VIIADDHELARAGLRSMLDGARGLALVGEASNGRAALARCQELQPDLALLDVRMPELDRLAATRAIKQVCPTTCVLIVTTHENQGELLAARKAGAAGYVLKDTTRQELLTAIWRVLRGEAILDEQLAARALQHLVGAAAPYDGPQPERLTAREHEVLQLLAQGLTNRVIAGHLTISVGTVKIHVEHIIAKLGVSDRTRAAVRAVETGLVRSAPVQS